MFSAIRNWFRSTPTTVHKPKWVDEFFDAEAARLRYTPDMPAIARQDSHLVFFCNEMQSNHHNNILLAGCKKIDYIVYTQAQYTMLTHDLGMFSTSLVFKDKLNYQNPPPMFPIKGELWRVPSDKFPDIDKYLNNTVFCFRQQVPIVIPLTHLMVEDRNLAERVAGRTSKPNPTVVQHFLKVGKPGKKPGQREHVVQAEAEELARTRSLRYSNGIATVRKVRREWAWMYFSDINYWGDYLNLNVTHPQTTLFENPDGLVQKYYRFTEREYHLNDKKWLDEADAPF